MLFHRMLTDFQTVKTETAVISTSNTDAISTMLSLHKKGRCAAPGRPLPASGSLQTMAVHTISSKDVVISRHVSNKHKGLGQVGRLGTPPGLGANTLTTVFREDSVC